MPKINKLIITIILEITFIFTLFIVLPSIFIKDRPGVSSEFNQTVNLDQGTAISQKITTDQDNLEQVSVFFKNPALENHSQITIQLLDKNKNIVETLNTSGVSVGDPGWINFKFPKINSKAGDIFTLQVSSDNPKPNSLFIYGNPDTKEINYKTEYATSGIKESIKKEIQFQINRFQNQGMPKKIIYLITIFILHLFIFLSL